MAERHIALYDLTNPHFTFADRYPYPLYQYVQPPPKWDETPFIREYDFSSLPLADIMQVFGLLVGDVLEIELLDRRVEFQGVQLKVIRAAPGVILAPFTNSGASFDNLDCGRVGGEIYLPFGGKLNNSTNLQDTAFVLDYPDYIGLRVEETADISTLRLHTTVLFSNTFTGLGKSNQQLYNYPGMVV